MVFPRLLEALASLEPGAELDMRVEALRGALDKAAADWPAIKPAGWKADRLSQPRRARVCGPDEPDPGACAASDGLSA